MQADMISKGMQNSIRDKPPKTVPTAKTKISATHCAERSQKDWLTCKTGLIFEGG
jgi:hypothetical protein